MKELKLLHLSDLHISNYDKNEKKNLIEKIITDYNLKFDSPPDLIIFTGDLVASGIKENYEIAKDIIKTLIEGLHIAYDKFIYIPGNHEVDTSSVKSYFFSGLNTENTKKTWEHYDFTSNTDLCHQMKEYLSFEYSVEFKNDIIVNKFFNINNCSIGITAINSAWFSKGSTKNDKDQLFIPPSKIKKSLSDLKDCEIKIAILHHPHVFLRDEFINDIEQELGKYDIVISGHIHDDSIKKISLIPGNYALFTTGNEISINDNNGYSVYYFSLLNQKVTVFMRKYYKKREKYDSNCDLCKDGIYEHELNSVSENEKNLYKLFVGTKDNFVKGLDLLMITNVLETSLNKDFITNFIMPKLTTPCTEKKFETKREEINFEELLDSKYDKIFLLGKKEVGKTVFANYIAYYYYTNFITCKKIPVVINSKNVSLKSSTDIINKVKEVINLYSEDTYAISNNVIKKLLLEDYLILIFDDFSIQNDLDILIKFKKEYNLSKIYFVIEDSLSTVAFTNKETLISKLKSDMGTINVYIEEFSKNQIRQYSKSLLKGTSFNADELCSKTVSLFKEMSLPKTPFAVSLFISICSIDSDFEPTNKSKIVEKLIEILLEKLSSSEIYLKSYGFDSKCTFLSEVAYDMYIKNQFYYTTDEFMEFVINYHKEKIFPLEETKFDTLFFDKNVLIKNNGKVMFRFKCFIFYFLALYFSKKQNLILDIIESEYYYNYDELFEYYSGINKGFGELSNRLCKKFELLLDEIPNLNELLNLNLLHSKLLDSITQEKVNELTPLSDEEKDLLTDINIDSDYDPTNIDMKEEKLKTEKLLYTMHILGCIIKNSEDLLGEEKIKYLTVFMNGSICLIGKIFNSFNDMLIKLSNKILDSDTFVNSKKNKLEKLFAEFSDIVKITIPLVVQSFILESVGTRKLKGVIELIIENYSKKDAYLLLNYLCLFADLRIEGWDDKTIKFLETNNNNTMLTILLVKCCNYLELNYFDDDMNSCKKVLKKIYEVNGNKKEVANNLAQNHIKKLSLQSKKQFKYKKRGKYKRNRKK